VSVDVLGSDIALHFWLLQPLPRSVKKQAMVTDYSTRAVPMENEEVGMQFCASLEITVNWAHLIVPIGVSILNVVW
jgi:hypothetical protein